MNLHRKDGPLDNKSTSPLVTRLVNEILAKIASEQFAQGRHLTSQLLRSEFGVSGSPIRRALKELCRKGLLSYEPNRGFFVSGLGAAQPLEEVDSPTDEALYFKIAEDRLADLIPHRISESELMRRYDVTRSAIAKVLDRAAAEGWAQRRAGHGWDFLPILNSKEALGQSYRFRIAIEPAALIEPTFEVNSAAFEYYRERISRMAAVGPDRMSKAEIFEVGSSFHEMLMKCSGNEFFVQALQRINQVRRLVEYHGAYENDRLLRECREHLVLLDLLEEGNHQEASVFLRRHLTVALNAKTTIKEKY